MDTITAEQLQAYGSKVTILNLGGHQGHHEIRGALRYRPGDLLKSDHLALPLPLDLPVVLYGPGDERHASDLAQRLEAEGYTVRYLAGGLDAWREIGGEEQEASVEQPVPPTNAQEDKELDRRA